MNVAVKESFDILTGTTTMVIGKRTNDRDKANMFTKRLV